MEIPKTKVPPRDGVVILLPREGVEGCADIPCASREYLIVRRSRGVMAPGRLCFPGGGIKPGESPSAAAAREFTEELAGTVLIGREVWENTTPWNVHLRWFLGSLLTASDQLAPNLAEVAEFFWMTPRQLLFHPDMLASNIPFLKGVLDGSIDLRTG